MSKNCKVLSIVGPNMDLLCIKDTQTKYNPYRLYLVYPDKDKYGYPTRHRKLLVKYQDMTSIICHIRDLYLFGFDYKDKSNVLLWNKQYCGGWKD